MSERVLTPGGFRDQRLVHPLLPGHALDASSAKVRQFNLTTRESIETPDVEIEAKAFAQFAAGWIAYAAWTNETGEPISSFRTTWRVPKAPASQNGQTIFLFNGIDPAETSKGILQPVLQWGSSAAGGGPYWTIASWYVSGDGLAFHTKLRVVDEGDLLTGVMRLTHAEDGRFNYAAEFEGLPETLLPIHNLDELVWCNQTLEAYSVVECSDYPASEATFMQEIAIRTGHAAPSLNWSLFNQGSDCGQTAVQLDNGDIALRYR